MKPRPTKPEGKDEWQHPTPHPIKTNTFTQQTDSQTSGTQQNESEDDLYEIYRDAPDRYITTHLDISNEKIPENLFESEHETSPQTLPEPLSKNNFESLQTQDPSEIPTEPASIQKLPLIDDEIQNHLKLIKKQIYQCFSYQPT